MKQTHLRRKNVKLFSKKKVKKKKLELPLHYLKQYHQISGLEESGWTLEAFQGIVKQYEDTSFYGQCKTILRILKNQHSIWPFLKPVNINFAPRYREIIEHPMDLETVDEKLESRKYYRSKESFKHDINLIFSNAKLYNGKNTIFYLYALSLENFIKAPLESMTEPKEQELQKYDNIIKAKEKEQKIENKMSP